ncbi:hypothetical protein K501DRAFT_319880 [Backusella circina FSU 941]|nr:hypothetical protein K501DRAFT_264672 [Backusella circina FSU 941]KAI8890186.1 hypothetical protein K501DRAFT_319880 [Backusella circina FSU 941]
MNSTPLDIPQFVVIRDQIHNTYKHPVVHYVFQDEEFPDVQKDKLIVVDLDESATQLTHVDSYSPHFQVTDCLLEQSQVNEQFEEDTGPLNLTIEGVSAPKVNEAIESLQPIRNMDGLKETIFNFKNRNEMVKKVFQNNKHDGA